MQPITVFKSWYQEEIDKTDKHSASACCLSTIGTDGYPNARFVSLKEIVNNSFVITGPIDSRKGIELKATPKAAITFWWNTIQKQVRIQGKAIPIDDTLADRYFNDRSSMAKLVSNISEQGSPSNDIDQLKRDFENHLNEHNAEHIKRPENWSGFYIDPIRIEFMEFHESRFHLRTLYQMVEGSWSMTDLQP